MRSLGSTESDPRQGVSVRQEAKNSVTWSVMGKGELHSNHSLLKRTRDRTVPDNPVFVGNRREPVYKPAVLGDFVPDNPAIIYLRYDWSERGFSGAARAPCASSATPASPPPRGAKSPTGSSTRSARPVASAQSSRESRTRGPGALVGSPVLCLRPGHSHGCRRQSPCPSKRIVDVDPEANSQCRPCRR